MKTGRRLYIFALGTGCALSVAACGMGNASSGDAPSIYKTEEKPAAEAAKPAESSWNNPATVKPVLTPSPSAVAALSPASYSPASSTDMNQRIDRLEKQVTDMRNDMNMMMPALTKLVNAQQDLQQVLARMDTASGNASAPIADTGVNKGAMPGQPATAGPARPVDAVASAAASLSPGSKTKDGLPAAAASSASDLPQPLIVNAPQPAVAASGAPLTHNQVPPPEPAEKPAYAAPEKAALPAQPPVAIAVAAPQPAPPAPVLPPPSNIPSLYAVSQIRFGEHANMTRMVLEASGKVPYTYELDKSGTLMTLHLPQTAWKATPVMGPLNSPTVDSWTATPDGQGGYVIAVKLKRPATVSWADTLASSAGDSAYRVVLDLTPRV